jgi:hypothetical protein
LGRQIKTTAITPILFLLTPILPGCVESESDRDVILRRADSYEQRGFSMTAADLRKEAASASDRQKYFLDLHDDPASSPTKRSSVIFEGNEEDGFDDFPEARVSVIDAIERAKPHLERSTLRRAGMLDEADRPIMILWVRLI